MSHRKEQVESTLQRAVSEVLIRRISDPRIEGMVSVTRVRVSDDFKHADVFITVLPDKFEKRTLAGLRAALGHIQTHVNKAVAMRTVPRLGFQLDEARKKEEAVFDAIARGLDREGLDPTQVEHITSPKADSDDDPDMGSSEDADDADKDPTGSEA